MNRLFVIAIFLALKLAGSQEVCRSGDAQTCVCDTYDNSGTIDLSVLGNATNRPWYWMVESSNKPALFFYSYNPCYAFTDCNGIPGLAMSQWPGDSADACFGIGVMNTSRFMQTENGSMSLHYHSADGKRTAVVHLECNASAGSTRLIQFGDDYYKYHFNFKLRGPAACPSLTKKTLPAPVTIIIIITVCLAVYLAIGVTYKLYKRKKFRHSESRRRDLQDNDFSTETTFRTVRYDLLDKNDAHAASQSAKYGSTDEETSVHLE